jgi:hypothetical protein
LGEARFASTFRRHVFGLMFPVFGANGFLHFIQQAAPSSPFALQFLSAVSGAHFRM